MPAQTVAARLRVNHPLTRCGFRPVPSNAAPLVRTVAVRAAHNLPRRDVSHGVIERAPPVSSRWRGPEGRPAMGSRPRRLCHARLVDQYPAPVEAQPAGSPGPLDSPQRLHRADKNPRQAEGAQGRFPRCPPQRTARRWRCVTQITVPFTAAVPNFALGAFQTAFKLFEFHC